MIAITVPAERGPACLGIILTDGWIFDDELLLLSRVTGPVTRRNIRIVLSWSAAMAGQ